MELKTDVFQSLGLVVSWSIPFFFMRSPVVLLAVVLSIPVAIQSGKAAESRFPQIKTDCKTYSQAREPIDIRLYAEYKKKSDLRQGREDDKIRESLSALIRTQQWDAALIEVDKISSDQLRNELGITLIEAMSREKETDRALRVLLKLFPDKMSSAREEGIEIIAINMLLNDQFDQALQTLKLSSNQDSSNLGSIVTPAVSKILNQTDTSSNEPLPLEKLEKIRRLLGLFPTFDQQRNIWGGIVESIPLPPKLAVQLTETVSDPQLKRLILKGASDRWFIPFYEYSNLSQTAQIQYGMEIANSIDSCVVRSEIFLQLSRWVVNSNHFRSQFTLSAKWRMLDQIESLLNSIDLETIGDRYIVSSRKLDLVDLNIKMGRNTRSLQLLEQVLNEQKNFRFHADRTVLLLKIASYSKNLDYRKGLINALEATEVAVQKAYLKNEDAFIVDSENSRSSNLKDWRNRTFDTIISTYDELNLIQKADQVERSYCKPLPPALYHQWLTRFTGRPKCNQREFDR